jgi:hypothetical protein
MGPPETPDPRRRVVVTLVLSSEFAFDNESVGLLADETGELLLANDKGLIEVARSHAVDCWWVTTLLLKCRKDGVVDPEESKDVLYDHVDAGMNLSPQVYVRAQRKLDEVGE